MKARDKDHVPPFEAMFLLAQCKETDVVLVRIFRQFPAASGRKLKVMYPQVQVCLPHLRWHCCDKDEALTIEQMDQCVRRKLNSDEVRFVSRLPEGRQCWTCCRQAKTARRKARAAARAAEKERGRP